jgi:hypothetical protein
MKECDNSTRKIHISCTYCCFARQRWLRERATVLRWTHAAHMIVFQHFSDLNIVHIPWHMVVTIGRAPPELAYRRLCTVLHRTVQNIPPWCQLSQCASSILAIPLVRVLWGTFISSVVLKLQISWIFTTLFAKLINRIDWRVWFIPISTT